MTVCVVLVSYERQRRLVIRNLIFQTQGGTKTYDDARHVNVQHPLPGVVRPMDLYEVGLEVIGNGLEFVWSFAVRRDAVKASCIRVRSFLETRN